MMTDNLVELVKKEVEAQLSEMGSESPGRHKKGIKRKKVRRKVTEKI